MLNWNNTTLDIVRAFKNFHATRLLVFDIAATGRQQFDVSMRQSTPTCRYACTSAERLSSYSSLVNLSRGSVVALSEGGISQRLLGASTFNSQVMAVPLVITSTFFATSGCI